MGKIIITIIVSIILAAALVCCVFVTVEAVRGLRETSKKKKEEDKDEEKEARGDICLDPRFDTGFSVPAEKTVPFLVQVIKNHGTWGKDLSISWNINPSEYVPGSEGDWSAPLIRVHVYPSGESLLRAYAAAGFRFPIVRRLTHSERENIEDIYESLSGEEKEHVEVVGVPNGFKPDISIDENGNEVEEDSEILYDYFLCVDHTVPELIDRFNLRDYEAEREERVIQEA